MNRTAALESCFAFRRGRARRSRSPEKLRRARSDRETRMSMQFILRMAWRDSRSSRWRLLLFSISISLGVAALIAIGLFRASLTQAIDDQARSLLGADLVVESSRPFTPAAGTDAAFVRRDPGARSAFSDHGAFSEKRRHAADLGPRAWRRFPFLRQNGNLSVARRPKFPRRQRRGAGREFAFSISCSTGRFDQNRRGDISQSLAP